MDTLNIKVSDRRIKIAVIGDIHAHDKQFFDLVEQIKPSEKMWLISVGDIFNKGFGEKSTNKIIHKLQELKEQGIGFTILGNHEVKRIRKAAKNSDLASDELFWMSRQPYVLSFVFSNNTRLTVLHGGVTPKHTWADLRDNSDVVYVRKVDESGDYIPVKYITKNGKLEMNYLREGKIWHEVYDGRFGYVASGHNAQRDGVAKFYKYSCNLDTCVYNTGTLTAQIFSQTGRERLLQATGIAAQG